MLSRRLNQRRPVVEQIDGIAVDEGLNGRLQGAAVPRIAGQLVHCAAVDQAFGSVAENVRHHDWALVGENLERQKPRHVMLGPAKSVRIVA